MKHVATISRAPKPAQTTTFAICNDIANDFQAQLCFVTELLVNFFLPIYNAKSSTTEG